MSRNHEVATFHDGVQAECFNNTGTLTARFRDVPGLASPAVEVDAELFYVGTHRGRKYTSDDLRGVVGQLPGPDRGQRVGGPRAG